MKKVSLTKSEHKRFRGLTVSDKVRVWSTNGPVIHITGEPKMMNTLRRNLRTKFNLKTPVVEPREEYLNMWFGISNNDVIKVVSFIERFNSKRKHKVSFFCEG